MDSYTRANLAGDVGLRTFLLCAAGGAAIGTIGLPLTVMLSGRSGDTIQGAAALGVAAGLGFGLLLGVVGAFVMGGFAALTLVPYRGRRRTHMIMRVAATAYVGLGWSGLLALLGGTAHLDAFVIVLPLSVLGALLCGGLPATPYIEFQEALQATAQE